MMMRMVTVTEKGDGCVGRGWGGEGGGQMKQHHKQSATNEKAQKQQQHPVPQQLR